MGVPLTGFIVVPHATPLAVTVDPPWEVTFPPKVALVATTEAANEVVTDGDAAVVVNVYCVP